MRNLMELNAFRVNHPILGSGDETCGPFVIPSKTTGQKLNVIASSDLGWDHVSVSLTNRCPNWPEMEQIKRLFFKDEEWAMQLHAAPSDHINVHPYCLHVWRPQQVAIPIPPTWMVA